MRLSLAAGRLSTKTVRAPMTPPRWLLRLARAALAVAAAVANAGGDR